MRTFTLLHPLLLVVLYEYAPEPMCWAWTIATNRRRFLLHQSILLGGIVVGKTQPVSAACTAGDLSPDCIGVFKTPPGTSTVDAATSSSLREALTALQAQRLAADDIATVVGAGRLEEAGIKVLRLISILTASGQAAVRQAKEQIRGAATTDDSSPAAVQQLMEQRLDDLFLTADGAWKSTDVTIGQGIRGQLGATAVAQIRILAEIREATAALDDFLVELAKLE